jgi:hypothetical protein
MQRRGPAPRVFLLAPPNEGRRGGVPANGRLDSESTQVVGKNGRPLNALRLSLPGYIKGAHICKPDVSERVAAVLVRRILEERCAEGIKSFPQGDNEHQAFGILER